MISYFRIIFSTKSIVIRRIVLSLILIYCAHPIFAYDFNVGGLYYNILTSNTVEVTYKNSNGGSYSGSIVIPSTVKYNNNTYRPKYKGNSSLFLLNGNLKNPDKNHKNLIDFYINHHLFLVKEV